MDDIERTPAIPTTELLKHQINYIKINGVPGVLFSDFAEITVGGDGSEKQMGWNRMDNGDTVESRAEREAEDEVLIKLPFAGADLTIRLLFYPHEPWMPPDLTFSDANFSSTITLKDLQDQVPSLSEWNISLQDILAQLVHQIVQLYRHHQLERLEEDDILQIQYQSLLRALKIGEGDIEVSVKGSKKSSMLVRLPLSLEDVPPVLVDANPGPPTTLLQIDFTGKEGMFVPKLHLSPRVESVLGGASTLALPAVRAGVCLLDYVENVMEKLEERLQKILRSFEMRKQLIAQVLCQFGCAVVEFDAERFTHIVLLWEVKDFCFLASISLGPTFPQQDGPKVTLRSIYHSTAQTPISKELVDLSYSAAWKPEEMVEAVRDAVLENITAFQNTCIRSA